MTNRQINRQLRHFDNLRREWIAILDENPGHSGAPVHLLNINAKMEMLRSLWNWNDESVEMEIVR